MVAGIVAVISPGPVAVWLAVVGAVLLVVVAAAAFREACT
jgi:hypothetical protein